MDAQFDDDDDDLWELAASYVDLFPPRRPRLFRNRANPLTDLDEVEFRARFRVTKQCFADLLTIVEPELKHATDSHGGLLPIHQLAITLRFYASGSFLINIGDMVGVSKSSCSKAVKKVTRAIAQQASHHITFPTTCEDQSTVMREFFSIAGFPGVLGTVDCTHIPLQSPGGDNAELFRNRKGYFSLNVQAVVSSDLKFTNVVARWYGSAHDSTIFSNSHLCARFEAGEFARGYLLGDAGYPCKPYLLTPLASPTTPAQQRYNYAHIQTRNTVERAFGVVKRRFPCLRLGLRVKVETSLEIVVACFTLHNLCIGAGDTEAPDDQQAVMGRPIYEDVPATNYNGAHRPGATSVRDALILGHFG